MGDTTDTRARARSSEGRKIGLALGSGSARGLAHLGVLRALREAGVEVGYVAGTSMGALIGAVFAAGKIDGLAQRFLDFDWRSIVSLLDPIFPRSGLIDGQKVTKFVREQVSVAKIEDLTTPFCAVATDLATGKEVVHKSGDVLDAVRASIAVPGVFTPVRNDGRTLVDGGLVNPVPVSAARDLGADFVIAVDLNHDIVASRSSRMVADGARPWSKVRARLIESLQGIESPALAPLQQWLDKESLPGIIEVLLASIFVMQARISEATLERDKPDILIRPRLGDVRFMEFDRAEEIIEIGYEAATKALAENV